MRSIFILYFPSAPIVSGEVSVSEGEIFKNRDKDLFVKEHPKRVFMTDWYDPKRNANFLCYAIIRPEAVKAICYPETTNNQHRRECRDEERVISVLDCEMDFGKWVLRPQIDRLT